MYALWNKITIKLILCYNLYASCYSIYSKLSCNFIKMRLRGKCPLVNMLHIFGTPIRKYTTGGLLVGEIISMSMFLAWMHVYFISLDRINTVFCQYVFYFNLFSWNINVIKYYNLSTWLFCKFFIRPWLEYHTSSILLCSHGAYCINRVCTQKTFNLFRLALSIIIFVILFRVGFLNLLFGCVWGGTSGEGRGRGQNCHSTLTFTVLKFYCSG